MNSTNNPDPKFETVALANIQKCNLKWVRSYRSDLNRLKFPLVWNETLFPKLTTGIWNTSEACTQIFPGGERYFFCPDTYTNLTTEKSSLVEKKLMTKGSCKKYTPPPLCTCPTHIVYVRQFLFHNCLKSVLLSMENFYCRFNCFYCPLFWLIFSHYVLLIRRKFDAQYIENMENPLLKLVYFSVFYFAAMYFAV